MGQIKLKFVLKTPPIIKLSVLVSCLLTKICVEILAILRNHIFSIKAVLTGIWHAFVFFVYRNSSSFWNPFVPIFMHTIVVEKLTRKKSGYTKQSLTSFHQHFLIDLGSGALLKKYQHGATQNVNELLQNLVWTRCQKRVCVKEWCL